MLGRKQKSLCQDKDQYPIEVLDLKQSMKTEEEEEIVCLDESFFINDKYNSHFSHTQNSASQIIFCWVFDCSYELTTFTFGSQILQLFCLQSASSDYDLTGQLVWPGATLMNNYLSKNLDMLQGCSIIELGSGIGVTGILCSRFSSEVVLTDHNEEVLKLLKRNIELHSSASNCVELAAEKLEWGNTDQTNQILERYSGGFDLVLGADICFQQCSIRPLFNTVDQLLRIRGKNNCKFILAYVSRAKMMDTIVTTEAIQHGMKVEEIPGTRSVVGNGEGVIFEITLR